MRDRFFAGLDRRLRLKPLLDVLRRTRPTDYISPWQAPPMSPGRLAAFLVVLLFGSGLALTFFYVPTAEDAAASVAILHQTQPLGWLVHNLHRWSALLLFGFAILHALRVWVTHAYRYPRDLNWWIGLSVLLLVIILGGTGYLLRWDIKAFALMDLVISNLAGIPVIGSFLVSLILGGGAPNVVPLNRGYALHVWFLPMVFLTVIAIHLLVVWRQGLASLSATWKKLSDRVRLGNWVHLLPGLVLLVILLGLSFVTPHAGADDPLARSVWPHPDWLLMLYFLPFWFFKGETRVIGTLIIPLAILAALALAPRLLRRLQHPSLLLVLSIAGVIAAFLIFGQMSVMGTRVPLPGCQACHRPGMIEDAPTRLSDFDIRDPDWLVFHLRDPRGSLLVPFSESEGNR